MALFGKGGIHVTGFAFVKFTGLLQAGHGTQRGRWTDR